MGPAPRASSLPNPGGSNILDIFGSASPVTDTMEILGQTSATTPVRITTVHGFGLNFAAMPTEFSRTYTVSGSVGTFQNQALNLNSTVEGTPSDLNVGAAIEVHSVTFGTSGSPFTCRGVRLWRAL